MRFYSVKSSMHRLAHSAIQACAISLELSILDLACVPHGPTLINKQTNKNVANIATSWGNNPKKYGVFRHDPGHDRETSWPSSGSHDLQGLMISTENEARHHRAHRIGPRLLERTANGGMTEVSASTGPRTSSKLNFIIISSCNECRLIHVFVF